MVLKTAYWSWTFAGSSAKIVLSVPSAPAPIEELSSSCDVSPPPVAFSA